MTQANERLKSFIERIERLNEEKAAIQEDIKEVFSEAKGVGYDIKAMREVIKLRKMDADQRAEFEHVIELYKNAIGV